MEEEDRREKEVKEGELEGEEKMKNKERGRKRR